MLVMSAQALLPIISGLVCPTYMLFLPLYLNYKHQSNSFFKVVVWCIKRLRLVVHQRRDSHGYKAATISWKPDVRCPFATPHLRFFTKSQTYPVSKDLQF